MDFTFASRVLKVSEVQKVGSIQGVCYKFSN